MQGVQPQQLVIETSSTPAITKQSTHGVDGIKQSQNRKTHRNPARFEIEKPAPDRRQRRVLAHVLCSDELASTWCAAAAAATLDSKCRARPPWTRRVPRRPAAPSRPGGPGIREAPRPPLVVCPLASSYSCALPASISFERGRFRGVLVVRR